MVAERKAAQKAVVIEQARKAGHLAPSVLDARAAEERRRHDEYLAKREKRSD